MASAGVQIGASILKLGMGLLAAHDLRYKDAINENAAVVQAVGVFDNDLASIFSHLNAGTISEQDAISYLQQTEESYWKYVDQYAGKPGVASQPCGPLTPGNPNHFHCDAGATPSKLCTAGCYVGCANIHVTIANAIWTIQQGGGTFNVCEVHPNTTYKNPGRPSYALTYTRPNISSGTVGAAEGFLNSLGGIAGQLTGSAQVAQQPGGSGVVQSGQQNKILTYLALGLVGYFVVRSVTQ